MLCTPTCIVGDKIKKVQEKQHNFRSLKLRKRILWVLITQIYI